MKSEWTAYTISRNGSKEAHLLMFIELLSQILRDYNMSLVFQIDRDKGMYYGLQITPSAISPLGLTYVSAHTDLIHRWVIKLHVLVF